MKGTVEMEVVRSVEGAEDEHYFVRVECEFTDIVEGRTNADPDDCYPSSGGELLETTATVDGVPFGLTPEEQKRAEDWCWSNAQSRGRHWNRDY